MPLRTPNLCKFRLKRNPQELCSYNNNQIYSRNNNIQLYNQNSREHNNSYNLNRLQLNSNSKLQQVEKLYLLNQNALLLNKEVQPLSLRMEEQLVIILRGDSLLGKIQINKLINNSSNTIRTKDLNRINKEDKIL